MGELMTRHYHKEEEFLRDFEITVVAIFRVLGDEWLPNRHCDDDLRRNRRHLLMAGKLSELVFDGATVCHDAIGLSSAQVALRSSNRVVNVRVNRVRNEYLAETEIDRVP